jgi:hypothetical protein
VAPLQQLQLIIYNIKYILLLAQHKLLLLLLTLDSQTVELVLLKLLCGVEVEEAAVKVAAVLLVAAVAAVVMPSL